MASKAAAALSRIREIDEKYKSKQEKRYSIFSESSISIDTEKPQKLLKPQLNIKMPDPYEECINATTSSESKKCSVPIKIIYKLPEQSSNSNDNSENQNNVEKNHETTSDKITTDNEDILRKDETNESISEILEDTQSPSQISSKLTKSKKSTDENDCETSTQNTLSRNKTSKSEEKISTEEEYEEEEEEVEEEKYEIKNSLIHYSDESFESSSSKTNNSPSTVISGQLQSVQSKINHEKVSPKVVTLFSKNESNTSNDIVSDYSNVNHNSKLQKSEEKLSTSTKSSNSSNNNISNEKLSDKSSSKNEKIDTKSDEKTVQTTQKESTKLESTSTDLNKQQIKSSELTSQTSGILSPKCNKKKSKESENIMKVIESPRQSLSSSSSRTSSLSKSSKIIKLKDSKKKENYRKSKYVYHKPNEKYYSAAMIHYTKKLREEQQKLHMLNPQIICSNKIKMQSIKPLDFPNILNFVQNNEYKNPNLNLEILQNHLSNIRQWLKEQYLTYKKNSEVAVHMNKNYYPTTLNETKTIIYQLQSKAHAKNKNQ